MELDNFKYADSNSNPLLKTNFHAQFVAWEYPKEYKKHLFYIKLYLLTEYNEHIIINCFRDKNNTCFSPRNNMLDFQKVPLNADVRFTLQDSGKGHYNIINAYLWKLP